MNHVHLVAVTLSAGSQEGSKTDLERGQGLTEFALMLPILLVVLLGIFDFGRVLTAYAMASNGVRDALRQLAAGPQDMRDEALLQQINDEMKKLPVDEIAYIRDRVRFSCPPCPMVQSVVLMLDGLIDLKKLSREL